MRNLTKYLFFTLLFSAFALHSCKKKCDLGENVNSGAIVPEMSIFPDQGYLTSAMETGHYLVTDSSELKNRFKISRDKGITKTDVNYSEYSLLAFPVTSNCYATFDRNVTINDSSKVIVYKILVKDCGTCDSKIYTENWVVIPAVDDSYTILYDVKQKTTY